MKISPLDIRKAKFKKSFNGIDAKEVENFLELLANDLEKLLLEHNQLKDDLHQAKAQLLDHQEREGVLKETLVTAQKMTTDIKSNAQKEAELIIKQSEIQAEKIINMANQRLVKLIDDINEMKRQRARLESALKNVLDSHYEMLDVLKDEEKRGDSPEEKIKVFGRKD